MTEQNLETKGTLSKRHSTTFEATFYHLPKTRVELNGDHEIDDDLLTLAKTDQIQLTFYSFIRDVGVEKIVINISEGDSTGEYSNSISVSGPSREWVNGTFVALQDILKSFPPQKTIYFNGHRRKVAHAAVALVFGYYIIQFLVFILGSNSTPSASPDPKLILFIREYAAARYLLYATFMYLVGAWPAQILLEWLFKIWPRVEFDFGPEHLRTHKNARLKLMVAFTIVGGPLIYDVLKYLVTSSSS